MISTPRQGAQDDLPTGDKLKRALFDAEGANVRRKVKDYFGLELKDVRVIRVLTIDADLDPRQIETARTRIFTNPVTERSSFSPHGHGTLTG